MPTLEQHSKAEKAAASRRRSLIREGVSKDALRALKEHFQTERGLFLFRDKYGMPYTDAAVINLQAAIRDGQREVIAFIAECLSSNEP